MKFPLTTPLSSIKGIGPRFTEKLAKLDIVTVKDILYHLPFRYQDFSQIKNIANVEEGGVATIYGLIEKISVSKTFRRHLLVITITVTDETGKIQATWFNQRYLLNTFKEGMGVNLAGKVSFNGKKLYLSNPEFEIISQEHYTPRHTGRIVPIYPETKGITSKGIRFVLSKVMDYVAHIEEFLPQSIMESHHFPLIADAFRMIHYPESLEEAARARDRFAFQDLFLLQLINAREKDRFARQPAPALTYTPEQIKEYFSHVPFELTIAQKKALYDILEDLTKDHATNRLLQGDVGSGKTIVAALAALVVAAHKKQVIFMAPTEVLALQHYYTFKNFFAHFSDGVAMLTASHTAIFFGDGLESDMKKKELAGYIAAGKVRIIIGTHAVIQKNITFNDVGLIVIDEQHRFGVHQRAHLLTKNKDGFTPHFLSMSATPIPRTLALTVFGDLDLSLINELPKDRKKIITKIVSPTQRPDAYAFIRQHIQEGRQAYVVCPRIQPTDPEQQLTPRQLFQLDAKNVETEYATLSKKIFPDLQVGMLHGQMKAQEKNAIMKKFKDGDIDILVSTSVIEVGVDVPNATIMMIEGAEKFGLAQLYQFRGRVGRGEHQSYCFLLTDSRATTTQARLKALITAKNGFELAEKDLKFRGPGQFLGSEQTGLPDLAMQAMQNPTFVQSAREEAFRLIADDPALSAYPYLAMYLKLFRGRIHME